MTTETAHRIAPADLRERSRRGLADAERALDAIERAAGSDRASVLEPYDDAWLSATTVGLEAALMKEVHPDAAVRSAAEDVNLEVTRFHTRLQHSRALYDVLGRLDPSDELDRRLVQVVRARTLPISSLCGPADPPNWKAASSAA